MSAPYTVVVALLRAGPSLFEHLFGARLRLVEATGEKEQLTGLQLERTSGANSRLERIRSVPWGDLPHEGKLPQASLARRRREGPVSARFGTRSRPRHTYGLPRIDRSPDIVACWQFGSHSQADRQSATVASDARAGRLVITTDFFRSRFGKNRSNTLTAYEFSTNTVNTHLYWSL